LRSSLFGSFARGDAGPESDVDILIDFPEDKTLFDLMDLEENLRSVLGRKVDVITYRSLHHLLRDRFFKSRFQSYEQGPQNTPSAYSGVDRNASGVPHRGRRSGVPIQQDAAERRLQIIGEAIVQLPWEFKDRYPDIPWEKVAGLRNRLVHEYFDIDHKLVWNILEKSVPEFKKQIESLLEEKQA
jgi:uncharacterized protein with HEPN domain/predicted nucleotidyltransferase